MYRDFQKEQVLNGMIGQFFSEIDRKDKIFFIPEEDEETVYRLLSEGIGNFQQIGEVFVSDSLKRLRILQTLMVK
jgi:hypothetical protein